MTTAKVEFTAEEQKLIKSFNKEERETFDSLPSDKDRKEMLSLVAALSGSTTSASDIEIEEVGATGEESDLILVPNGLGLKAGTKIKARFLGTVPMFSVEPKENWPEVIIEGRTVFTNHYYKFEDIETGRTFGIYQSPMLKNVLTKIPTHSSNKNVSKDPIVTIQYDGKIEDKALLKERYGFELQKGSAAHAFVVGIEKGIIYNKYRRGIVNYLRSPLPNFGDKEKLSDMELAQRNWENLEKVNGNVAANLGHDSVGQQQISM